MAKLAIAILGARDLAAALGRNARDATPVLPLLGSPSPSTSHPATLPQGPSMSMSGPARDHGDNLAQVTASRAHSVGRPPGQPVRQRRPARPA